MEKLLKNYLPFYLGADVLGMDGKIYKLDAVDIDGDVLFANDKAKGIILENGWQLMLRPLSSLTEGEALKMCSIVSPTVFGDFRYKKWTVFKGREWDKTQKNYEIKREGDSHCFVIDCIDGDILLYEDDTYIDAPFMNFNYRFEYLKMGFDLFGLKEAGLVIYKN